MTAQISITTDSPRRKRKPWTPAEVAFASRLRAAGHQPEAIAIAMPHRTPSAIREKLWHYRTDAGWELDLRGKLRGRGLLGP